LKRTLFGIGLGIAGPAASRRRKQQSAVPDDKPALVAGFAFVGTTALEPA
jgi:hypothetical protein